MVLISLTKVKLLTITWILFLVYYSGLFLCNCRYLQHMSKGRNIKKPGHAAQQPSSKKYLIRKIIMIAIIIILGLLLYIDAKTGLIKNLVGEKTFEIRIRK